MKFTDRLSYIDQCVAGEKEAFQTLLSQRVFNAFDRGYDLFRDYVHQKSTITDVSCTVDESDVILHIQSTTGMGELISENIPKKGVTSIATPDGVDLHIKISNVAII